MCFKCVSIPFICSSMWTLKSTWISIKFSLLFAFSLLFNPGTIYTYITWEACALTLLSFMFNSKVTFYFLLKKNFYFVVFGFLYMEYFSSYFSICLFHLMLLMLAFLSYIWSPNYTLILVLLAFQYMYI